MAPNYVVRLAGSEDGQPYKSFSARALALAFAQEQCDEGRATRAEVYEVHADDARSAVNKCEAGDRVLIALKLPKPTKAELERADKAAFERALAEGPEALLKYLGLM